MLMDVTFIVFIEQATLVTKECSKFGLQEELIVLFKYLKLPESQN